MVTVVIGDVHGCAQELEELLKILPSYDRLVLLGDLMDRGPDPVACVRLVRELKADCTKSNHDEKHYRWRKHERTRGAKKNPVRLNETQVKQNLALTDDDIDWMGSLPCSIALDNGWYAIHAGLEPCKTFDEQKDSNSLIRTRFLNTDGTAYSAKDPNEPDPTDLWYWSQRWFQPEKIVYGHHIHDLINPRLDFNRVGDYGSGAYTTCAGIDTGCYAGGRLTALVLGMEYLHFEHVQAKEVYYPLSDKYRTMKG